MHKSLGDGIFYKPTLCVKQQTLNHNAFKQNADSTKNSRVKSRGLDIDHGLSSLPRLIRDYLF